MLKSKALIPLYINENLLNNLFTVVIQEFVQIKTISTKSQQAIKISTPLANVIKGCYLQGTFNLELLDEYSKQRTEERISKIIVVFLETKQILEAENILNKITSSEDIHNIKENDYVELSCRLNKNPQLKQIEDIIKYMEMRTTLDIKDSSTDSQILNLLKSQVTDCKEAGCLRLMTDHLFNTNVKAIVPIQQRYVQDNIEDLYNNVTILGKVVNVNKATEYNKDFSIRTCLDLLHEEDFREIKESIFNNSSIKYEFENHFLESDGYIIEILPIAMYI